MGREAYLIVVTDPAAKEGYIEGVLERVTFNLVQLVLHVQGHVPQCYDGTYRYFKVSDGNYTSELIAREPGMIADERPVTQPLGDYLRMSLSDMRAALLGGMRASDAREIVEAPIYREGTPEGDAMVDLQAARDASNGEEPAPGPAPKKSKRA